MELVNDRVHYRNRVSNTRNSAKSKAHFLSIFFPHTKFTTIFPSGALENEGILQEIS